MQESQIRLISKNLQNGAKLRSKEKHNKQVINRKTTLLYFKSHSLFKAKSQT